MAQIDPKALMEAAMRGGGSGAAPPDSMPIPGAAGPAGGTAAGPQGGMQDALPQEFAGAQPAGLENSGVLNNAQLQQQVLGAGGQGAGPGAGASSDQTQQMLAALNDPKTPPDMKNMIQSQLQLAALRALTAGPSGAVGSPSG